MTNEYRYSKAKRVASALSFTFFSHKGH